MCLLKNPNQFKHYTSTKMGVGTRVFKVMKCISKPEHDDVFVVSPFRPYVPYAIKDKMKPAVTITVDNLDAKSVLTAGVIHSYLSLDTCNSVLECDILPYAEPGERFCIVECMIPEGTPYWVGMDDTHCASTELILEKILLTRKQTRTIRLICW